MTAEPNRLIVLPRDLGPLIFVADLEPLPLVDPTEAAAILGIARHTLACYRHLGDGPPFYKFGRWIRYARDDLRRWRDGTGSKSGLPSDEGRTEGLRLVAPAIAARFLTVTIPCLRNYRLEGSGPAYLRYSNRIHYPVAELLAWAERHRQGANWTVRRPTQASRKRPIRG